MNKYKLIQPKENEVVQIFSDEWYVGTKDHEGRLYWKEMNVDEQLKFSEEV